MIRSLLIATLSTGLACGQSFESPIPETQEPQDATVQPSASTEVATDGELINTPSKNVGLDVEAYVRFIRNSLDIRNRRIDPFGRYQDPNYKPAQKPTLTRRSSQKTQALKVPFGDQVASIPITIIDAGAGQFIVNSRTYKIGESFPLKTGNGTSVRITPIRIESGGVTFRNDETGETANKDLGILPNGMSRGTNFTPAGLIPPTEDRAIDISQTPSP